MKRHDGRKEDELRKLKVEAGVLKRADGSALVEWGNNKALVGVYGPQEVVPKHMANPYRAIINCNYRMAPFSSKEEHGRGIPNRRAYEIGKVAKHVFENAVLTNKFPETMINIQMEILQSDGGTRVAAITAAAVALADAGIPMRDIPAGVAVGKVDGEIVADLDKVEDNTGEADIPLIFSPKNEEILLLQMDGLLTKEEFKKALEMAKEKSKEVHELQVKALKKKYEEISKEVMG